MYSPYYNDIQTIRSLNQRCVIAKKLYAALLSKDSSDNQPPTNQNKPSPSDIDEFKNRLYESLSTIPYIPLDYFNNYYDRLFYEIIFEVYHYSQIQLLQDQRIPCIRDCINQLLPHESNKGSIEEEISRNKKNLLYDFNNLKPLCTYNKKLNIFYGQMGLYNNGSPIFSPTMTPENTVIILRSYSDSIFNMKNSKDGILLHTVYKIIDNYLNYFGNDSQLSFNKEYCFYEFNHIYRLIQYSKCASEYLNPNSTPDPSASFTHTGIPSEYFPLYIYSKLFDTSYISIIDFICKQYKDQLTKIYNTPSVLRSLIIRKELINTFWIPIINLCLKDAIFIGNNGDFESICKTCKDWLVSQMASSDYTYTALLHNAKENIGQSTYPNPQVYQNRKDIKDQKYVKTDTPNHQFNIVLSKAFFYNDFPDYLSTYPSAPYSLDYCLDFVENNYETRYHHTKDYSLKSCNEYITLKHDAGIIAP